MRTIGLAALAITATLAFAPTAGADPGPGHAAFVRTQSPSMTCMVASDDADSPSGPNVVCQSEGFPESTIDPSSGRPLHQALVTSAGNLTYRDANLGEGGDDFQPPVLSSGTVYHLQGWTILPTHGEVTFTSDATGHGMTVSGDRNVTAF